MLIDIYLREMRRYPVLNREEELEVANKAVRGDSSSRQLLINSNLRFAFSLAIRFSHNGDLEDLVQQANYGLALAADRFKPEMNFRFISYAKWWIEAEIKKALYESQFITLPPEKIKLRKKINTVIESYLTHQQIKPSHEQIASELNKGSEKKYTPKDVADLFSMFEDTQVCSLDNPINESGDSALIDLISRDDGRDISALMGSASTLEIVHKQIKELKQNELTKKILYAVLYKHKTFGELSKELSLIEENVKQNYSRGIRCLNIALRKNSTFIEACGFPR